MNTESLPSPAASQAHASSVPLFRKILVPVDFSVHSERALRHALRLAERDGAAMRLVFVVEPAPPFSGLMQMPVVLPEEEVRARCEQELSAMAKAAASERCAVSHETRSGSPANEIARCASQWGADLIVIPTHGRTGLSHVLIGSVAENVVRHAPCPVLVIRESK